MPKRSLRSHVQGLLDLYKDDLRKTINQQSQGINNNTILFNQGSASTYSYVIGHLENILKDTERKPKC